MGPSSSPLMAMTSTDILVWMIMWSQIEPCTSIIAACLPTLRPLFQSDQRSKSVVTGGRAYPSDNAGHPPGIDVLERQRVAASSEAFSSISDISEAGYSRVTPKGSQSIVPKVVRADARDIEMQNIHNENFEGERGFDTVSRSRAGLATQRRGLRHLDHVNEVLSIIRRNERMT